MEVIYQGCMSMSEIVDSKKNDKLDLSVGGFFTLISNLTIVFIKECGQIFLFTIYSLKWWFIKPYRIKETIDQIEFIGNQSVPIIILTGCFTGLAMAYEIYLGFTTVNAENLVGPTVALGITRELGPVLTGLIVAARAGGSMAARLGTMKVTEQIDALDVMGVNPHQFLVAPRLIASIIAMPLLTIIFDIVAILGAYFLCVYIVMLDPAIFWQKISDMVEQEHINEGLFKSAVFGIFFSIICTYRGFNSQGGAKGVGEATNRGVVLSMVLIIVADYFLTAITRIYYQVKESLLG